MKTCLIIGGGIVGLSTAYFLHRQGHQVTLVDQSDITSGASFVNAGYLTPSHIVPLAAPGMVTKGLRMMFNPASPFYLKPRADKDMLLWMWHFYKSANARHVRQSIKTIADINVLSKALYTEMKQDKVFEFHLEEKGVLNVFKTEKTGASEIRVAEWVKAEGLEVEILSQAQLKALEPHYDFDALGAVFYKCDAHTTPTVFMKNMLSYLETVGVAIHRNEQVTDFEISNNKIVKVHSTYKNFQADEVILATGSWSPVLMKRLGIRLSLQAGKGYSINVYKATNIQYPAILMEAKVAVTPMQGFTRFGGTMELGGINHHISNIRVNAIAEAAKRYYPGLEISKFDLEHAKCGLRPVSPDGLPYIGRIASLQNATLATGHAMMGWSLGPATGKLVSEIISGEKMSMDIRPFKPDRRF
ncbi:MAG: FAD-dependent oxidoreductase [Flavobacteriaceae bacterium]|nr:FAD-dependent oxidoreductase [Flavobacteriaceae bacterium]